MVRVGPPHSYIVRVYLHILRVIPTHHVRKNVVGGLEGPEPTST